MSKGIRGIDLYHADSPVQFGQAKADGIQFVICKASQGLHSVDDQYTNFRHQAHTAGLLFGAYHFFDPNADPFQQAAHFVHAATPSKGDLVLTLDVETPGPSVAANAHACVKEIKRLTGFYPWLYSGDAFYQKYLKNVITECPLWIARYSASPPSTPCEMWQYTDNSREPGTPHPLDGDLYFGTLDDLKAKHTIR